MTKKTLDEIKRVFLAEENDAIIKRYRPELIIKIIEELYDLFLAERWEDVDELLLWVSNDKKLIMFRTWLAYSNNVKSHLKNWDYLYEKTKKVYSEKDFKEIFGGIKEINLPEWKSENIITLKVVSKRFDSFGEI